MTPQVAQVLCLGLGLAVMLIPSRRLLERIRQTSDEKEKNKILFWAVSKLVVFVFVVYIGMLSVNLRTVKIEPQTVIVDAFGEEVARFEDGIVLWASDERVWRPSNTKVSYLFRELQLDMEISPITENPKVRPLRYHLDLRVGGTPENAIAFYRQARQFHQETDWLKSRLYEFNEKKSKELAEFYNPLDRSQQTKFHGLVYSWLREDLGRGKVELIGAWFSLP